jgi:predicted anti-sigma-YlaC factor YlaD
MEPAATDHLDAWRVGLALVALVQIALAVPALLFGSDAGLPVHTARHLGSFDAALGIGFLVIAWKPSRVPGLLPVTTALVACLFLTSIVDVASGRTAALSELTHITELLGLALCLLIGRATSPPREPRTTLLGRPA